MQLSYLLLRARHGTAQIRATRFILPFALATRLATRKKSRSPRATDGLASRGKTGRAPMNKPFPSCPFRRTGRVSSMHDACMKSFPNTMISSVSIQRSSPGSRMSISRFPGCVPPTGLADIKLPPVHFLRISSPPAEFSLAPIRPEVSAIHSACLMVQDWHLVSAILRRASPLPLHSAQILAMPPSTGRSWPDERWAGPARSSMCQIGRAHV